MRKSADAAATEAVQIVAGAIVAVPTVPGAIVAVPTVGVPTTDAATTVDDMADAIVMGAVVTDIVGADGVIPVHGGSSVQLRLSEPVQPMQAVIANV